MLFLHLDPHPWPLPIREREVCFDQKKPNPKRRYRKVLLIARWLVVGSLLITGCFSHPRVETLIHEDQDGAVYLKEFPDPSFRANHPLILDPQLIEKVLLGVRVHERKTIIESTLTGDANATPALTLPEVSYLTPLLVSAFEQATTEEEVHFRIKGDVSGKRFDTAGVMFVTGELLNFSLTEYGLTPQRPGTLSQPTKSFDRPKRWSVTFTPISAVLNAEADKQVVGDENVPKPILINLEILQQYSPTPHEGNTEAATSQLPTHQEFHPNQSTGSPKSSPTQEDMKEEIRDLRKSLKEQEERLRKLEGQTEE